MNTIDQPRGDFISFINREKKPGDNRPASEGRFAAAISNTDGERRHALWANEYPNPKTGEVQVMLNGQAGTSATSATALEQITSLAAAPEVDQQVVLGNLTLAPGQIVLFPNNF